MGRYDQANAQVAHVAPIFSPIPPLGYGGIERVLDELTRNQSSKEYYPLVLYASRDSRTSLPLRAVVNSCRASGVSLDLHEVAKVEQQHYNFACMDSRDCALLHAHGTWIMPYTELAHCPIIVSVYTDTSRQDVQSILANRSSNVFIVANSEHTRSKFPEAGWEEVILEGLQIEEYPYCDTKGSDLLFVGELTPQKGAHIAIQVALHLGLPLRIIGRWTTLDVDDAVAHEQEQYVTHSVAPFIDGIQIRYLGELGSERLEHIKRARAVLCPISWGEPFGRIMAETMACGTSVIAFNRGAVSEVIADGISGFIVDNVDEMIEAVRQVNKLSPRACRAHAQQYLHIDRVSQQYFDLYTRILQLT